MAEIPIGVAVRNVRLNRGLTQQQVATRMGCPRTYIAKIEHDFMDFGLGQFIRVSDAMQIEPWTLLRYAEWLSRATQQPAVPPITLSRAPEEVHVG